MPRSWKKIIMLYIYILLRRDKTHLNALCLYFSSSLVKGTAASWNSYDAFVESQELVLDVVHGDQVVLKRKVGLWKAALFLILCVSQVYLPYLFICIVLMSAFFFCITCVAYLCFVGVAYLCFYYVWRPSNNNNNNNNAFISYRSTPRDMYTFNAT